MIIFFVFIPLNIELHQLIFNECIGFNATLNYSDKSYLLMVYNTIYVLLDSVCLYFVEDFYIYIHMG